MYCIINQGFILNNIYQWKPANKTPEIPFKLT